MLRGVLGATAPRGWGHMGRGFCRSWWRWEGFIGTSGGADGHKLPCALRLDAAQGLILLGQHLVDPALVMPQSNVPRDREGLALQMDLNQSHCPQCLGMCVPMAWPWSHQRGTGDEGHQLPVLAASSWGLGGSIPPF